MLATSAASPLEGAVPARTHEEGRDWARAAGYLLAHLATHVADRRQWMGGSITREEAENAHLSSDPPCARP